MTARIKRIGLWPMSSKLKILRPEFKLMLIAFSTMSLILTYLDKLFSIIVRYSSFCLKQHRSRTINSYFPVIMGFLNTNCFFFSFFFYLPRLKSNTRGSTLSVARGNTIPVAPVTVYDAVGRVTAHVLGRAR